MRDLARVVLTPTLVRGLGNFSGLLSLLGERPWGHVAAGVKLTQSPVES